MRRGVEALLNYKMNMMHLNLRTAPNNNDLVERDIFRSTYIETAKLLVKPSIVEQVKRIVVTSIW